MIWVIATIIYFALLIATHFRVRKTHGDVYNSAREVKIFWWQLETIIYEGFWIAYLAS